MGVEAGRGLGVRGIVGNAANWVFLLLVSSGVFFSGSVSEEGW